MNDLTVIYYTGNYENQTFEERVRETLLRNIGDLPLISVSQKPINLGRNICVGDVGRSGPNAWRQFKIGAMEAKTKFVCPAEADFIYPPEYFQFQATREDTVYLAHPVYVLFWRRGLARRFSLKERGSEGAIIISRDLLIRRVNEMYAGLGGWEQPSGIIHLFGRNISCEGKPMLRENFNLPHPVVTFKTNFNMDRRTNHNKIYLSEIPYWGKAIDLIERFST